jgi:hypothetical protein
MKKILSIISLVLCLQAVSQNFEKTYPYWDEGEIWAAIPDNGGYSAIGFGRKGAEYLMFIIKTDLYGDTLQVKRVDAGNYGPGYIRAIATDQEGNHYIAPGTSSTIDLMKFSPDWELLWTKLFSPRIWIKNIIPSHDGNLLMQTGFTSSQLLKTDPDANILWASDMISYSTFTTVRSIIEKDNGDILVFITHDGFGDYFLVESNIYTFSASGELLSTGFVDTGYGSGMVLSNAFLKGNEIFGLICSISTNCSLAQYLPDGSVISENPIIVPYPYFVNHFIFSADSSIVAINHYIPTDMPNTFLYGLSSSGDSLWIKTYGNENRTTNFDIRLCPDGGFLISGCLNIKGTDENIPYLIKTDNMGNTGNVGINESPKQFGLKVYPNPAVDRIVFESSEPIYGIISILDMSGRKIANIRTTGLKTEWNTGGLKPGVYFYKIENKGDIPTGKLIIGL